MEVREAILAFSQSEKIKAGLIWTTSAIHMLDGIAEPERKGAERVISTMLNMVAQEVQLAGNVAGGWQWNEIDPFIERALVMINSRVVQEAGIHLSKALSKTTNIGQQSMTLLQDKGLL